MSLGLEKKLRDVEHRLTMNHSDFVGIAGFLIDTVQPGNLATGMANDRFKESTEQYRKLSSERSSKLEQMISENEAYINDFSGAEA